MPFRKLAMVSLIAGALTVAGCADNQSLLGNTSSNLTTSAVTTPPAPKIDPACAGLAAQIDGLRKEGIVDKMDKAAQKKQKVALSAAETAKADQLNKATLEFQSKCSSFKPAVATAAAPTATAVKAVAPAASASAVKAAAPAAATSSSQY